MSEYDRGPRGGGEYPYGYGQGEYPQGQGCSDQQPYDQPRDQWGRRYPPAYTQPQGYYGQQNAPTAITAMKVPLMASRRPFRSRRAGGPSERWRSPSSRWPSP